MILHVAGRGQQRDDTGLTRGCRECSAPNVCGVSSGSQTWKMFCHHSSEVGCFTKPSWHIAVCFRNAPALSCMVKIEPYHATRCGSHWCFFRQYSTQGRGQTQLLEQFRPTRNLFLCVDCFLGESFGLRSDLIPNTAFQHEWKRCQCIHIAHLWIPFAAFEHRAAPESRERGR